VKILEGDLKAMKEKLALLFNKGNDDDALIDALKRELIAAKQQHQGGSARVTSAGREKPPSTAGAGSGAPSAQLTSSLKSDIAKVNAARIWLHSFVCDALSRHCRISPPALHALERAAKAEAQVDRQHKIIVALKGNTRDASS
jgi:hypothetical protein